jgi:hypothetical protein
LISLSDDQLTAVMRASLQLPVDERTVLLQRIAARLQLPDSHYSATDLDNAVRTAVQQLIKESSRPPGTIYWLGRGVRRVRQRP